MHGTLQRMISGINSIPDLYVIGPPQACGVAFNVKSDSPLASDSKAIFKVADAMGERGWFFPRLQNPISCMMQVAARSNFDDELFVSDLRECVEDVKNHPENFKEVRTSLNSLSFIELSGRMLTCRALFVARWTTGHGQGKRHFVRWICSLDTHCATAIDLRHGGRCARAQRGHRPAQIVPGRRLLAVSLSFMSEMKIQRWIIAQV